MTYTVRILVYSLYKYIPVHSVVSLLGWAKQLYAAHVNGCTDRRLGRFASQRKALSPDMPPTVFTTLSAALSAFSLAIGGSEGCKNAVAGCLRQRAR